MEILCSTYQLMIPMMECVCSTFVQKGHSPHHIAFVADGARRFGKKHSIPVQENHEIGLYKVMWEIIDWCLEFGVNEYSILMYSFGNYYRPRDEVEHWIAVLRIWLKKSIDQWGIFQEKSIRFNFLGKWSLIPADINAMMAILALLTKDNSKIIITMAMGYTGKHEMSSVACEIIKNVRKGVLCDKDIQGILFNDCLFTYGCCDPDLIIRTSGYKRISNFLTWQGANALIYFKNVLWPEFSKYNFISSIIYYQHHLRKINYDNGISNIPREMEKIKLFCKEIHQQRVNELIRYAVDLSILPTQLKDDTNLFELEYKNIYDYWKSSKYLICS